MLNLEIVKKIKQSNVSKNAEKTKTRIKEEFSAASKDVKAAIINQTAQNRNTIYRAQQTGNASGRIVLAFAEVLDITPYYFTGVTDEKTPCTDEVVSQFLLEYGYKKLVPIVKKSTKAAKSTTRKPIAASVAETHEHTHVVGDDTHPTAFRVTINESEKMRAMVEDLDLASATQLLEGLFIRAKAGGNAEQLCEIVKYCLLA